MTKKIFALILSFVMFIFPIKGVNTALAVVTDGKTVNISFEKNADTVINESGETLDSSTWFGGLEVNYGQYGGITKASFVSDGKINFNEAVYNVSENNRENTGVVYSLDYNEENGLDSEVISNKGTVSFDADLENVPTESVLLALKFEVGGSPEITFSYKDDTTESITIRGSRYAQAIYNSPSDIASFAAQKQADGTVSWVNEKWRLVSLKDTGNAMYKLETDAETGTSTAVYIKNETIGIHLYEIKLDKTKIPVSMNVKFDNSYHIAVYSIAQKQLTNDELISVVKEAEEIIDGGVENSDVEKLILANSYADILEERNYLYDFSKIRDFIYKNISVNGETQIIKNGEKNLFNVSDLCFEWLDIADLTDISVSIKENSEPFYDYSSSSENGKTVLTFDAKGESEYIISFGGIKIYGKNIKVPEFKISTGGIYKRIFINTLKTKLSVGESTDIKVFGETENNNKLELSFENIALSSSDEDVISVSENGKITANKKGNATLTAVFTDPISNNPYADENNSFSYSVDFKVVILPKNTQGNREKITFYFDEAVVPVEAYFSDKSTAQIFCEADVSFNEKYNCVDVVPKTPLDLSKEYVVTLFTEDNVYNKNIKFEFYVNKDFSSKEDYKEFLQNREGADKYFDDANEKNTDETLKIIHGEGDQDISMAYKLAYAKIDEWKDYTIEFDYLYEESGKSAKDFNLYFLSRDQNQVMWQYDKKQAATVSTVESRSSYILGDTNKTLVVADASIMDIYGDKSGFAENDLRVSGMLEGQYLNLNVRKINTEDAEENKLLYSQEIKIPVSSSELNRQTGTFAIAVYGAGASKFDVLTIDNVKCYKTKITDVEYSASIDFNARDLYGVNDVEFVWNYQVDEIKKSNITVTSSFKDNIIEEAYTDFSVQHENNKTKLIFNTPLSSETWYKVSFNNVTSQSGLLEPMTLSFFMGGVYEKIFISDNRFIKAGGDGVISVNGVTETKSNYILVNDYIEYSSDNKEIFTVNEDGEIKSKDRGYAFIKAVYNDTNTNNINGDSGTNVFTKTAPVYFYISKNEITAPSENIDFSYKNGVIALKFNDDLSKNISLLSKNSPFVFKTSGDKYEIANTSVQRKSGDHLVEILKYEGKISVYFDGEKILENYDALNTDIFSINGDFNEAVFYNLVGSTCKVSFVNVRADGAKLNASYSYEDADNDSDTKTEFEWLYSYSSDGPYNVLAGEKGKDISINGREGMFIKVKVTPGNKYEYGQSVTSEIAYSVPSLSSSSSGSSGGFGGSSSSGGFGVSGSSVSGGSASETVAVAYTDVDGTHWAFDAIASLTDKKVLNGFGDGSFKPENFVTRAEFVCALLKYKKEGTAVYANSFEDVKKGDWYADYVQKAFEKKYILGDGNNFNPNAFITREEMAVIIARAFRLEDKNQSYSEYLTFDDTDLISEWAVSSVGALYKNNIINGKGNNSFFAKDNTTRAEMAVIFQRINE